MTTNASFMPSFEVGESVLTDEPSESWNLSATNLVLATFLPSSIFSVITHLVMILFWPVSFTTEYTLFRTQLSNSFLLASSVVGSSSAARKLCWVHYFGGSRITYHDLTSFSKSKHIVLLPWDTFMKNLFAPVALPARLRISILLNWLLSARRQSKIWPIFGRWEIFIAGFGKSTLSIGATTLEGFSADSSHLILTRSWYLKNKIRSRWEKFAPSYNPLFRVCQITILATARITRNTTRFLPW